jgi:hypothetical protein
LDANQFLEGLVALGLVVHYLRAIAFAVGALFEVAWFNVLGWTWQPDLPGIRRL